MTTTGRASQEPSDGTAWWQQVLACALVGTARRPVPGPPSLPGARIVARPSADPETTVLDAAAIGGTLLRAGAVPPPAASAAPPPEPAAPDTRPAAPDRADQLLSLVVRQNPAGAAAYEPLVRRWCETAHRRGYRLAHDRLPQMLELGRTRPALREPIALVLGERGRWLATLLPGAGWARAAAAPPVREEAGATAYRLPDLDAWGRLPDADRLEALRAARSGDPALGRSLVESTLTTDPARTRRAHLEALGEGLGPDDEPLLERALDDRAATVRAVAASLLDGLPGSARAARMADRLRASIRVRRLPRLRVDVELPDDPDAAGLRDGLGEPPPGRSRRAHWLTQLTSGAPLSVWTDASGTDPVTTYARIGSAEVREGIRLAVARRGDREWARAVALTHEPGEDAVEPDVVRLLEPAEAERLLLSRAGGTTTTLAAAVRSAPPRWSSTLTTGLLDRCRRAGQQGEAVLPLLAARVDDLHPVALPLLEAWADAAGTDPTRRLLRDLVQHLSLNQSIEEALAP